MKIYLLLFFSVLGYISQAQHQLTGVIVNENDYPLSGAHIHAVYQNAVSDADGTFTFSNLQTGDIALYISYLGYQGKDTIVSVDKDIHIQIQLLPDSNTLDEVVLQTTNKRPEIINKETVSDTYIQERFSGSLASSLQRISGVNATEIGAGASKPIVRGLGFNRVVVAENGTKHEGQQWGADHGLEIDAFAAEEVEVIKNSGAIEYGSDAIGGVVNIKTDAVPNKNSFTGSYTALGRSANHTFANSLQLKSRGDKFFYKLKATTFDYGDYNVPTDTVTYLTIKMPVYNNRLKNTAGKERNLMGQVGFVSDFFRSILTVSNTYLKAGFFPGSHGVPSVSRVLDDGDRRNIEFPYQRVNHFKLTNTNTWFFNKTNVVLSLNYQNNRRQEYSEFHTHFGNQEAPQHNPNLELDFNLDTFDVQAKVDYFLSNTHEFKFGIQSQLQKNDIGGYAFLLPKYTRNTVGAFAIYNYKPSKKWAFNTGVRGDFSQLNVKEYFDPILYAYLLDNGQSEADASAYALRSQELSREFSNVNFLLGAAYRPNDFWEVSASAGTNFRLPTAIELSANGIHHGSFRHEQGNPSLDTEKGFVVDGKVQFTKTNWAISFNPYLYYFSNYIFLQPSGRFSPLPHGGQIYNFTQSEAVLSGVELSVEKTFLEKWNAYAVFEYLYNQQLTKDSSRNYPLPFSPPINGFFELRYDVLSQTNKVIEELSVGANTTLALAQDRIAQNEEPTDGYVLFGAQLTSKVHVQKFRAEVTLRASNIFNTRYFNHTNFYRALEIPEMGRNIQLLIKIPFGETNG